MLKIIKKTIIFLISILFLCNLFLIFLIINQYFLNKNNFPQKNVLKPKIKKNIQNFTEEKIKQIEKMKQTEVKLLKKLHLIYSKWKTLLEKTQILTQEEEQELLELTEQYKKTSSIEKKHHQWMKKYLLFFTFCDWEKNEKNK